MQIADDMRVKTRIGVLADTEIGKGANLPMLEKALTFFSLYSRNEPFLMGQLSFAGVIYDVSFAAVFLALTVMMLDRRRYGRRESA